MLLPVLVRVLHQHGVVVLLVTGNFLTEPLRTGEFLILVRELDLCYYKSFIITVELIHLEGVGTTVNEISGLVNDSRLAYLQEFLNIFYRDFLLPFEAAGSSVVADTFDCDETFLAFHPYAHYALRN